MRHIDKASLYTAEGYRILDMFPRTAEDKFWALVVSVQDRFGNPDDMIVERIISKGSYTVDGYTGVTNFRVIFTFGSGWILTYFWFIGYGGPKWQVTSNFKRLLKLKRCQKFNGQVPYREGYKGRRSQPWMGDEVQS